MRPSANATVAKRKGVKGYALMTLGFLFCPCHLVIVLPLLGVWLGGAVVMSFINANLILIIIVSSVLFLLGMGGGWWLLARDKRACAVDSKAPMAIKSKLEVAHETAK